MIGHNRYQRELVTAALTIFEESILVQFYGAQDWDVGAKSCPTLQQHFPGTGTTREVNRSGRTIDTVVPCLATCAPTPHFSVYDLPRPSLNPPKPHDSKVHPSCSPTVQHRLYLYFTKP